MAHIFGGINVNLKEIIRHYMHAYKALTLNTTHCTLVAAVMHACHAG